MARLLMSTDRSVVEATRSVRWNNQFRERPPLRSLVAHLVLAPEDRHLVAQDGDLDGEIRITASDQSDELQDTAERLTPISTQGIHRNAGVGGVRRTRSGASFLPTRGWGSRRGGWLGAALVSRRAAPGGR